MSAQRVELNGEAVRAKVQQYAALLVRSALATGTTSLVHFCDLLEKYTRFSFSTAGSAEGGNIVSLKRSAEASLT